MIYLIHLINLIKKIKKIKQIRKIKQIKVQTKGDKPMTLKDEKGRWIDGAGNAIPVKYVKKTDKLRDQLVEKIMKDAQKISKQIQKFKPNSFDSIYTYMDTLEKHYKISQRTREGNKVLTNFSNTLKVEIYINKLLAFDDKLSLAKTLIDGCVKKWSEKGDPRAALLLQDAFKVDQKGKLDRERILGLRAHKIDNPDWQKAMNIIGDSLTVLGTKAYLRFWKKNDDGKWQSIPLSIAEA
jgi:hypothetical protein